MSEEFVDEVMIVSDTELVDEFWDQEPFIDIVEEPMVVSEDQLIEESPDTDEVPTDELNLLEIDAAIELALRGEEALLERATRHPALKPPAIAPVGVVRPTVNFEPPWAPPPAPRWGFFWRLMPR